MGFFKRNEYIIVIVGAITAVGLAIGLPFVTHPTEALLPRLTLAQLALSGAALFLVAVTLYLTIVQVRRAMAKPQLEVVFSDSGNSETSINIPRDRQAKHNLKLSVINKGNAITKLFQIDFKVTAILSPKLEPTVGLVLPIAYAGKCSNPQPNADNTSTISYYSNEQVYSFINAPASIYMLTLETRPNQYDSYPDKFTITYRVFGDWAETQEGILKVKINKQ